MPYSPSRKYACNENKIKGLSHGIFLLFLLLLPSAAQDLLKASDELPFACPQGPENSKCFCTLNEVNCTDVSLLAVPSGLGTNIKSLVLRGNLISSIDSITPQLPQSLVYIDLSFNLISFVDWSIFSALTNLEEIHLQMNFVYSVDLSYFHGTKLRILNISGNPLARVTEEGLGIPIEELYIENCGLSHFRLTTFKTLCKLKILHASGNRISSLPTSAFRCMTHLQKIDLSDNLLTTLPATIFDGLNRLKVLNLAGNPWSCDCSLLWLKVFLRSMLASGATVVNNDIPHCSTGISSDTITELANYSFSGCEDGPKTRRERRARLSPRDATAKCSILQTLFNLPCGPSKTVSCVYTFPSQSYSFIQLTETGLVFSKADCRDTCQENNNTYFFYDSSSTDCFCGDSGNIPGCTECSALTTNLPSFCNNQYNNVGEAISVTFDLTVAVSPNVLQVMLPVNFTLSGGASIYDTFTWNFGDATTRSVLNDKTTFHTYIYPGQFEVSVSLTSSSLGGAPSAQVVVRLTVVSTLDAGKLICPSNVVRASTSLNVTAAFTSARNQKVKWTRDTQNLQGQGRITEYEKKCEPLWTSFRNRCVKVVPSANTMAAAHLSCTIQQSRLLRFYSAEEISELTSLIFQSGSGTSYYTGAEWTNSSETYLWKNTSLKAYVFREILPNANKGQCVTLTSAGLQGVACSEQLPFVCEKDPVTCTGSQQSVGQTCFVVVSKPATWDQAQNACQSTYTNGKLASIFYSSDNLYISGLLTSRAWIGLRTWTAPGYYTWQGGQVLNGYANWASRTAVLPCVSTNSSGLWQTEMCNSQNSYVCEYFIGDEVKIPWLVAGFVPIMNDAISPVTATVMAAPQILTSSQVTLLLGSWFSASGRVLRWNIHVQSLVDDARLSLQIWRPFCETGFLIWPGCSNNTSPLMTCSSTPSRCPSFGECIDGQYLCMLTSSCLPISKPCTCASMTSAGNIDCQNMAIDHTTSKLRLISSTTIKVAARTAQIQFEAGTDVQAGDVIGFQSENKGIGICQEPSTSEWRHPMITASTDYWMDVGDIVEPRAYQLKKDTLCRINAVYSTTSVVTSPVGLNYVTSAGVYNFTLVTNLLSSQTCSVTAMEDVGSLIWVYPPASSQIIPGQVFPTMTTNVEAGLSQVLTLKILQGSSPTVTWFLNDGSGIVTNFSTGCPAIISSPPDVCKFQSSLLEYPYSSLTWVFPSGAVITNIVVNVTNIVSWEALRINIYSYAAITSVEFYHDECKNHTACEVIVETGKTQTFHLLVKAGDASKADFYEDGRVITPGPSNTSVLTRIFKKSAVYVLSVNVSNPLSWITANLTVRAQVRAKFNNLLFVKVMDKVAVDTLGTISAMAQAAIGAQILVKWSMNEESFQYSTQANTTTLNLSHTYRFNTTGNVTFFLLLSDVFGDSISSSLTITVYNTVEAPLVLSTSDDYLATFQDFDLTVRVENCSISEMEDYGMLTFTFDWSDGSQVTVLDSPFLLQVIQHQYKAAGVYTITVTVFSSFNTSNVQTGTVSIAVQDRITDLSLSYDGPKHFSKNITFTASQQSGSDVRYSIDFGGNLTNTSFQTSPVFVFKYSIAGVYRATVTARNAVSESTSRLILYVYDEYLLQIIQIKAKYYVSLGKDVEITADVATESPSSLFYEWDFGNRQVDNGSGDPIMKTHTMYNAIGVYTITLKVQKNISSSISATLWKDVCVEEEISGLSVSYKTPIALKQPRASVTAAFNASVTAGSNLTYTWTVGGSKDLQRQNVLNLTVTEAKIYTVTVKAENNLNYLVRTVELAAVEVITGLQISCKSCFLVFYTRTNGSTALEGSVLYGTIINYTWVFDDSSASKTGKLVQHNFTVPRVYMVALLAENSVSNGSLNMSFIAQDEVNGVTINTSASVVEINVDVTFQVTFTSGTNVSIQWKCDFVNVMGSNSVVRSFKSDGYHQCSAVLYNAVSTVTKTGQVAVLSQITVVAINQSLKIKPGSISLFAAVGFEYTFTPSINTNFLVNFEWRVQSTGSSITSFNSSILKYVFKTSGTYQVHLKAQNDISLKNVSIAVEAQEQISGVRIEANRTSPLQVLTSEAILFHAVIDSGSHLTYVWSLGETTLPNKNDSVILPFFTAGNYTVAIAVINDLDTVKVMVQVSVYVKVSPVAIQVKQSFNPPFVIRDTTLNLYSQYVSGTELVYSWTVTHMPSGQKWTSDLKSISFSFNSTGTYQVLLRVFNSLSSEEDYLTLVVQGAVIELKVTLQDSVVTTGSSLTFMAETNLDATNVTYTWQIDGETKLVPYFVKRFLKAGVYKIFLTASNNVSSVSKENIVIRILDPISNLQIKDCQSVRLAQNSTSLQAMVDSGSNVTFIWYVEIGNQNKTFTGQTVYTNFQNERIYNIVLTAQNDISMQATSCRLETQNAIGNVTLVISDPSPNYIFQNQSVTLTATGTNFLSAIFEWKVNNYDTFISKSNTFIIPGYNISATLRNYSVTLTVSNNVSQVQAVLNFTVMCQLPDVVKVGALTRAVKRSRPLELEVAINANNCTAYIALHSWTVVRGSNCSDDGSSGQKVDIGDTVTSSPSIIIGPRVLDVGLYCFHFATVYQLTSVSHSIAYVVNVTASKLNAIIKGGSYRTAAVGTEIRFNGTLSFDPDSVSGSHLTYSWTCVEISRPTVGGCFANSNSSTFYYKGFKAGQYRVVLLVEAQGREASKAEQTINVTDVSDFVPMASVVCESCLALGNFRISASQHVVLAASCDNCHCELAFEWKIFEDKFPQAISPKSSETPTGLFNEHLVLNKCGVLKDGHDYTFLVQVSCVNSRDKIGVASLTLLHNLPPANGNCFFSPTEIIPLHDKVTVECSADWIDTDDPESPITYKIFARSQDSLTGQGQTYVLYSGTDPSQSVYVSPFAGSVYVELYVMVGDEYGAYTLGGNSTIKFNFDSGNMTRTDYLAKQTNDVLSGLIKQASPISLLQYAIALGQQLNLESQKEQEAQTSGKGGRLEQTRAAVRDAVTICLSTAVPILTLEDVQQMALALRLLTDYVSEYLTEDSQRLLATTLQVMGRLLQQKVSMGLDRSDMPLYNLLSVVNNLISAANARIDSIESIWQSERTITIDNFSTNFRDLRPEIAEIVGDLKFADISLDEMHRKFVVSAAVPLLEHLLVSTLQTMSLGEPSLVLDVGGVKIQAARSYTKDIELQYLSGNAQIIIPPTVLSGKKHNTDEVFQVMISHNKNPYTYGYSIAAWTKMPVQTISFYDINGSYIQVADLPDNASVGMCMFSSLGNVSSCRCQGNSSGDADTGTNLNYRRVTLGPSKGKKWQVPTLSSGSASGVGMHIQLRFSLLPSEVNSTKFTSTGVTAHLGVNFIPSSENYIQVMHLTPDLMSKGVDHRQYTFFLNSLNPSDKVYIVATNDDRLSEVELSVGVYYSSCEYFNTDSQIWAHNGCQAQEESTAAVTSCKCNHLTSFGGAGIVSIADIDFSDLEDLDLSTNPVVFIAVTVIFVTYTLVTILCRYLDRLDLKRISKIPLCGQVGSFLYEVTIVTGNKYNAGTSSHIGIKLYGSSSKGEARHLTKQAAFQRNCRDTFIVAHNTNLGEITKILVWHDNTGLSPTWFLSHVLVKDLQTNCTFAFLVNSWLSLDEIDGVVQRTVKVSDENEQTKFYSRFSNVFRGLMVDLHTWISVTNKPDHSRFTRVQRCTCCLTCAYLYMCINAMWYGLFKDREEANSPLTWTLLTWEDVVIGLVSTLMVVPFLSGLTLAFKKSRCQDSIFQEAQRPGSAQTLEIDELCTLSGDGGSYRAVTPLGDWAPGLDRESTLDSISQAPFGLKRTAPMHRDKRKGSNDSTTSGKERPSFSNTAGQKSFWDKDNILKNWSAAPFHWPSNKIAQADQCGTGASGDGTVLKQNSRSARNFPGIKTLEDTSEDILQQLHEAEAVIAKDEKKRKKLTKKTRQANGGDLFNSDDEWTNEGFDKVEPKDRTDSCIPGKEAEPTSNLGRRPSHTNFTLPGSTARPDSAGASKKDGTHSMQPDGARPSIVSTSSKSKTILSGRLRSLSVVSQLSIQNSSGCVLPFWCVYVAYAVCIVLCCLSVILVLLYGYNFGANVAIKWLVSLCITLFISILIVEPLKVLVLTVYRANYSGGLGEDNSDMIDIKPQVELNEQLKDVKFRPLGGFALLQAKEEGKKKQRLHVMMREALVFTFMFALFLAIVYTNYNSDSMYQTTSNIHSKFVSGLDKGGASSHRLNITNLRSIPEFWQWTQTVLASSLHYRQLFPVENFGYLMGPALLRQIRGEIVTCPAALKTAMMSVPELVARRCVDSGSSNPETAPYDVGWTPGSTRWSYFSSSQLKSLAKFGQSLAYPGGGYVQKLGATYKDTLATLQQLKADNWVDLQTRVVFVEFALYSPSKDLISCVTLVLEFSNTGGILASSTIWTERLLRLIPGNVDPIMVCQVMFFPFILYVTIILGNTLMSQKLLFFTHFWNWIDLLICILMWTSFGLYITCVVMATSEVKAYLADRTAPNRLEETAMLHSVLREVQACLLLLFTLKIVRQVRFFRPLYKFYMTLTTASVPFLGIFFIFVILLLTYAQFGYLLYGSAVYGYHSFELCLLSLFGIMGSHTNFRPMFESQRIITHLYFISFGILVYGLAVALSVAALTWSYRWSRQQMTYKTSLEARDYEMIEFMIKRFKLLTGMRKQKPLFRHVKFEGLPSLPSRSTSSNISRRSCSCPVPTTSGSAQADSTQEYLDHCIARLQPSWDRVVKAIQKIENLDRQDAIKIKTFLIQRIKPTPKDSKLRLKAKPVLKKAMPGNKSTFFKLTLFNSERGHANLTSNTRIVPKQHNTSDSQPGTSNRMPGSSQKLRSDPKLNNDDLQTKKKVFQFGHQVKPGQNESHSAEQKSNIAYGFSASSSGKSTSSSDKRIAFGMGISGLDGSPNKRRRVWRSFSEDTEV